MKQKDIKPDQIVKVDLTGSAMALKPTVYKDRDMYFCLLGTDDRNGVLGSGITADQAIQDWDKNLQARLKAGDHNDPVVKLVKSILNQNKTKLNPAEAFLAAHLRQLNK